jgi:hypothetical protein
LAWEQEELKTPLKVVRDFVVPGME